ncbi:MAG: efflux RND transporter periplasmic adaptor subunit [Motiliproteus sp.]|nr:efflux RND transporter periplasmic adaptor subunit [Motiliproteus sp.]MCW9051896.1 efflux RND transporter periplasmic adaptor subunit [Motiliproteus sp.]
MTTPASLTRTLLTLLVAITILAAAVFAFYGLYTSRPQAADRKITEKIWKVTSIPAQFQNLSPNLTLYGRLESPRSSELTAAITAFVESRMVDEGFRVKKGDPLLKLDPRDAKLLVMQREAELEDIEAQLQAEITRYQSDLKALAIEKELLKIAARSVERFKELKGRNVGTDTQVDDARRSYQQQALNINTRQMNINDHGNRLAQLEAKRDRLQAQLQTALLDLERTTIIAPFDGRIAEVSVAPGDRVRSGDPLVRIYNTESMEVRAQIPSRFLADIRQALNQGESLTATADLDGQQIDMQLDRLSAEVGSGRAGIDALLQITSVSRQLELGRAVEIDLQLPRQGNLLVLPPQSLYGTDRIYIVKEGRLQGQLVQRRGEITVAGRPHILIASDAVKDGDQIVTTQLPNAITGLKVDVTDS